MVGLIGPGSVLVFAWDKALRPAFRSQTQVDSTFRSSDPVERREGDSGRRLAGGSMGGHSPNTQSLGPSRPCSITPPHMESCGNRTSRMRPQPGRPA